MSEGKKNILRNQPTRQNAHRINSSPLPMLPLQQPASQRPLPKYALHPTLLQQLLPLRDLHLKVTCLAPLDILRRVRRGSWRAGVDLEVFLLFFVCARLSVG